VNKIFYIANIRLPTEKAHGVQIMKTCEAIAENGAEVVLIVPRRFNEIKNDPFDYYRVKRVFSVVKIPTIDTVNFGKLGFLFETIVFSEMAVWYIRLNSSSSRIVYSRDTWPLINVCLLGWNIFWEAHMGSTSFVTKKLLKVLSGVVVISGGLKNLYEKLGSNKNKILVSPDSYDPKDFEIKISKEDSRKKLSLPLDKKIIMYVGLLDEWKGYKTLLESSRYIKNKDTKVVIIGGSGSQIRKLKEEYPNVIFLGYKNYSTLPENQKSADVLVVPNSAKYPISKYYTSPMKLFAHMASGVPIIASDIPSIREIVDENSVTFFKPDDPVDLAKTIDGVLNNNETSTKKAQEAKSVVSRYTWSNRGRDILDFINENV